MEINRDYYLNQLISAQQNGMIKIVTGLRRSGKSYLLFKIFYEKLIANGVSQDHIIRIALDDLENAEYREKLTLYKYVKSQITDSGMYYTNGVQNGTWER